MAKRERSKTRADIDMIALLKSRGVRGRLSKMTKAQLRTKLDETAPPPEDQEGDGHKPQRSGELELEADPDTGHKPYALCQHRAPSPSLDGRAAARWPAAAAARYLSL